MIAGSIGAAPLAANAHSVQPDHGQDRLALTSSGSARTASGDGSGTALRSAA